MTATSSKLESNILTRNRDVGERDPAAQGWMHYPPTALYFESYRRSILNLVVFGVSPAQTVPPPTYLFGLVSRMKRGSPPASFAPPLHVWLTAGFSFCRTSAHLRVRLQPTQHDSRVGVSCMWDVSRTKWLLPDHGDAPIITERNRH